MNWHRDEGDVNTAADSGLLLTDLRALLPRAHGHRVLAVLGALVVLVGILVPLWLLALGSPLGMAGAVPLILLGAAVVRYEIVRLGAPAAGGPAG